MKYLGVFINSQLKWCDHVKHITAKASRSPNYLCHSLFSCSQSVKSIAYKSIVRPILEYASSVWCLHLTKDVSHVESVQRHAARWVCGSRWNSTSHMWSKSSDSCINELQWSSLHIRRSYSSICLTHDILRNRVSIPFSKHFQFSSSVTRTHPLTLSIPSSSINPYRFSFFVNTPFLWNTISDYILQLSNRAAFRSALRRFLLL